ncbi:MAG TPA: hypothetical protein VEY13_11385 [Rubrobacteraceae bacterium]|nr:hypothetical protein [Rubrobacteraceae bacterium]
MGQVEDEPTQRSGVVVQEKRLPSPPREPITEREAAYWRIEREQARSGTATMKAKEREYGASL